MTPEAIIPTEETQAQQPKPNDQHKSVQKGVEGEAKPTRQAERKDEQTPPASQSAATHAQNFVFGIPQDGLSQKERQVQVKVFCGPCQKKICPLDHRCMTRITPGMVFDTAAQLLPRKEVAGV